MIKEIKYNGFTETPSDYECPDGDLAGLISLVPEDETIKPIFPPAELFTLPVGYSVAFIHVNSGYKHYIVRHDGTLYWFDNAIIESAGVLPVNVGTDKLTPLHSFTNDIYEVNAIGNTLVVLTSTGMHYILWKGEDTGYLYLGTHIPDIDISFGLVGHPRLFSISDDSKSTFNISFNSIGESDLFSSFSAENRTRITSQVMAKVNKFIKEQTVDKGRFCFPFLVRYALRLYDGNYINHSAPVLMNPSTTTCPVVYWKHISGKGSYTDAECDIMLVAASLNYQLVRTYNAVYLSDWKDIVKGIDVFISKPIYTHDPNGECTSFIDTDNFDTKFLGKLYYKETIPNGSTPVEDCIIDPVSGNFLTEDIYAEWMYSRIYSLYFSSNRRYPSVTIHMPELSNDNVQESIRNTSQFYKLCSIELDDALTYARKDIDVKDDYLQSLVSRETLPDDYLSHDKIIASYSFVYNQRLNLAGMKRNLFPGFTLQSMLAYCNYFFDWRFGDNNNITISSAVFSQEAMTTVCVYVKEDLKDYVVRMDTPYFCQVYLQHFLSKLGIVSYPGESTEKEEMSRHSWGTYFFYPNVNAYKIVIFQNASPAYEIKLQPHDFLNGAYAMLDYELVREKNTTEYPSVSSDLTIDLPNKIYTSEVNNPFYFPSLGINTVGTGIILGICSAVRALSQGQFGQFPLYAFTTEGVWALEVSSEGKYTARQPVTRDVCINSDSITQIDTAVLFVTDRGIMLISGSNSQCISDTINSQSTFSIDTLPNLRSVLGNELADEMEYIPFREYIQDCRMLYDYTHQRIIVYNPSQTYAYVYSLKSKQWGMMSSDIQSSLNSYPDALALLQTNEETYTIVNYSEEDSATETVRGILVTRPLKLDAPDVLKTVDTIIQRGYFRKGNVKTILYASRDLFNWQYVYSSADHYLRGFRGTPYKYFRIALICDMQKDESIFGCTVQFTPRLANQPR